MSEQTSRLAVIIDSSGAQKNTETLASSLAKLTQAGQKAADGAGKVTKATQEESQALSQLLDRIDPVNAALNKLDQQQQQLAKFKAKGFLDTDTFDAYSKKIDDARSRLGQMSEQLVRTGQSSKQAAFAMRLIPAQMTDIVVGLSTGQSPFMVLMQQGGQLKDMFGGIGPAIKGVGGYVTGLINPFTLGAAAVGLFGAALYSAEKQASAMNIAANNLNNISGLNLSQMTALAQGASGLGVSYGDAVTSVGLLSQSLSTQADLYPRIIKASSDYSNASGQDLNDVIGMFSQLSDSSGKSIDTLDDKLGFLTVSQRKQADEALRSGNIADAQRIAFDALSGKLEDLTKRLNQGATGWDNFWHSVGRGTSSTWETFKEVVGGDYLDNADVRRYQQRTQQREQGISLGKWTSDDEQHYQMLNKASSAVQSYIKANEDLSTATKNAAGQSYLKSLNSDVNANADAVTKARKAIIALDNQFKSQPSSIQNQGRSDYQARRSQLEQSLSDALQAADRKNQPPRQRQGKAYSEDAGTRLIDQINQQTSALTTQLNTTDKLSSVTQQRIKFEQQIAEIKGKSQLTADQKSLLSNYDAIEQAYKRQELIQNQVTTLDDYRKMQDQVRSKDQQQNDLLADRLKLLDKAKAAGAQGTDKTRADIYKNTPITMPSSVTSAIGSLQPTGGELSGSFAGLSAQYGGLDKAQNDLKTWLQSQEDAYAKAGDITQAGEDRMNKIRQEAALANQQIEAQKTEIISSSTQSMMDSTVSIMQDGFGKQSAAYKVAFAASKAFAIADSMVKIQQAIASGAVSGPYPANIIAMASIAAQTASIVSSISSVSATGFQSGGYTGNGGVSAPAGIVHGQEFVMDAGATRRIGVNNLEAIRKNGLDATLSRSGFGTGAKNVNNSAVNHHTTINQTVNMPQGSGVTPTQLDAVLKKNNDQLTRNLAAQAATGTGKYGKTLRDTQGRGNRMT